MDLSNEERTQLRVVFGCAPTQLDAKLDQLAGAGREEYIKMALGQRVFTRGQDILEYRLLLLIRHVFGNRLPPEQAVSDLFQTTISQSRTLLRSVTAKYQYELQTITRDTIKDVLSGATADINDDEKRRLTITNVAVVEALNRMITGINSAYTIVSRVPGTGSTYSISKKSFDAVKQELA